MSNPDIFFIGDTHFGHKLIAKVRGFGEDVEAHDEFIIEQWNSVVKPKDIVWHLGDVAFGKENLSCIARCNGNKKLVMGNHDQYATEEYLKYFHKLFGVIRYKEMVLSHVPIHPNSLEYRWTCNVHGHIHDVMGVIPDERYICVNADCVDLAPVHLDHIKHHLDGLDDEILAAIKEK